MDILTLKIHFGINICVSDGCWTTKNIGDNFEMLVTESTISVTNNPLSFHIQIM